MRATCSPAQQAASRRNGTRSRGLRTDAGKARSARNGTKHGLRGGPIALLPGEDRDEFAALHVAVASDRGLRDAYERRRIAALAGLAPVAKDSGQREHRRVIQGGRGQVRNALDMAALASLKTDKSPLKARYAQLIAKGKPPKLALGALMRKMLVTLNAMIKAGANWQDPRQK